jgi:uncharacterized protein DUF4232
MPDRAAGTATARVLLRVAVAAAAVLTAGCGGSGTSTPAPPPATVTVTAPAPPASAPPAGTASAAPTGPAGTPRCTTPELSAALGAGEGAAGSVYRPLVFTNTGSRTCELRGFPGVSYVAGDDGHQVGPAAAEAGERGGEVVLRPGGQAAAAVQFAQVANFDAAVCRPTPVRGLRVYPPGDTASLFVAADGTGCAGTPPGPQLSVQTVAAR